MATSRLAARRRKENRWQRIRLRVLIFLVLTLFLALGYNLMMGRYGFVNMMEVQGQISELEAEEIKLAAELIDLELKRDRLLNDSLYIEHLARKQYQLSRPGETIIE